MSAEPTARWRRVRGMLGRAGLAALFCLLFNLFVKLLVAGTADRFIYHWDAVLWLFLDTLVCVAIVELIKAREERAQRTSSPLAHYARIYLKSAVLFTVVSMTWISASEILLFDARPTAYHLISGAAYHLIFHLVVGNMYLGYCYLAELGATRDRLARAEQARLRAEQARLRAELRSLRQSVEPHFFFNSLNILGSLIERDPARAQRFLEHLARLYRYLLRHRDEEIVPLREELAFVLDYVYLLKERFGDAWRFEIAPGPAEAYAVVPAAIQGLVENAVKHNRASQQQPLTVWVRFDAGRVVVDNERRPLASGARSNATGLADLKARYAALAAPPVDVQAERERFVVALPLIPLRSR